MEVLLKMWEKEKMPVRWRTDIIYTLLKKEDGKKCENHRGITFLDVAYKIVVQKNRGYI